MTEDPKTLLQRVLEAKERAMSPEKLQRRREVDARNAAIQKVGVKAPASGTFGGKKKEP